VRITRPVIAATALCLLAATPAAAKPGALDTSFGKGGVVQSSYGVFDTAYAITALADGKVVVGGGHTAKGPGTTSNGTFVLTRHLPNGRLDTSFGNRGVVRTAVDRRGNAVVRDLLQYADGRLLAAGRAKGGKVDGVVLTRYLADGRLDRTFSDDGLVVAPVRGRPATVNGAGFLPDGGIVVCGTFRTTKDTVAPFVQRFLADGRLDTSFGDGGTLFPPVAGGGDTWGIYADLVVLPDTSVVVAGWTWNEDAGDLPLLVRLLPNGLADPVFGASVPTDIGPGAFMTLERTVDGLVLAGGAVTVDTKAGFNAIVSRFLPTGTLDPAFGVRGVATLGSDVKSWVSDLVPVSGGRIVGVGTGLGRRDYDTMLWRLTPLGTTDPAFGAFGVTMRGLAAGDDIAYAAVAGPADSVTTAGTAGPVDQSRSDTVIARFLG
jgi:uncharacterized delta-60 repeat protein